MRTRSNAEPDRRHGLFWIAVLIVAIVEFTLIYVYREYTFPALGAVLVVAFFTGPIVRFQAWMNAPAKTVERLPPGNYRIVFK